MKLKKKKKMLLDSIIWLTPSCDQENESEGGEQIQTIGMVFNPIIKYYLLSFSKESHL